MIAQMLLRHHHQHLDRLHHVQGGYLSVAGRVCRFAALPCPSPLLTILIIGVCPSGTTAHGTGNFSRTCTAGTTGAPKTTTTAESTTTGIPAFVGCTQSASGYFQDGSGLSCSCHANCESCQYDYVNHVPSSCSICKNNNYLWTGACFQACPIGTLSVCVDDVIFDYQPIHADIQVGSGHFNRQCHLPTTKTTTTTGTTTFGTPNYVPCVQTAHGYYQQGTNAACSCGADCESCSFDATNNVVSSCRHV